MLCFSQHLTPKRSEYVHAIAPFSVSFALIYCWNMLVLCVNHIIFGIYKMIIHSDVYFCSVKQCRNIALC